MKYLCLILTLSVFVYGQEKPAPPPPEKPSSGAHEKAEPREKARQLLDAAAKMVTSAQPQVQVAALLHLGENYNLVDPKKALECLEQAFAASADLPSSRFEDQRGQLQAQIVNRTAEVSLDKALEMLPQLAAPPTGQPDRRMEPTERMVRLLLDKKDFDLAMRVVEAVGSSGEYPFRAARSIFEKLDAEDPRRVEIFGAATTAFIGRPNGPFGEFLSRRWQEAPRPMAESALRAVINAILDRKEEFLMSTNISTAKGTVSFKNRQDRELFEIMHVLRALDPKRADELLETRPQLRSAVERFPLGTSSMGIDQGGDEDEGRGQVMMTFMQGPKLDPQEEAQLQVRALARSRAAEALSVLKQNPQRALALVRGIPDPATQAEVLGSIARSVSDKDPATAKSVLDQCIQILDGIKSPMERIEVWDIVAEAAHRAKEDERAWQAIDGGLTDAAALYKQDTDAEDPNQALRETWPSTHAYRSMVGRAATLFGAEAEPLLAKITDPDLALLATIEMAQALLGRPSSRGDVSIARTGQQRQRQNQVR